MVRRSPLVDQRVPRSSSAALAQVSANDAARLVLATTGLLAPAVASTKTSTVRTALVDLINELGFVQIDSINVAGRAHELILHTRLNGYGEGQVWDLLEERNVFEAFTHDASLIPSAFLQHWRARWQRDQPKIRAHPWWKNLLGESCDEMCAHILQRITAEGPLGSADFEHPEKRGPWWGWKPQKASLDYLWRIGTLAIPRRHGFQKLYDLAQRVFSRSIASAPPNQSVDRREHIDWACQSAAQRLVIFNARELAGFWGHVDLAEARQWCKHAVQAGELVEVECIDRQGQVNAAFASINWQDRLAKITTLPPGLRLLSPFDPLIRDRQRLLRTFGFDYRFEAFTPSNRRTYGYYVLPILEGERLIGRLDPKVHRARAVLEIKGLWWEPGERLTKRRRNELGEAVERLARFLGATTIDGL